jgi:molecular chaperone GrpE (heat shock protein)
MSKADVYRKRAAECQQQADAAMLESVRATLLEVADKYLALADNEERSAMMAGSATNGGTPSPDARG